MDENAKIIVNHVTKEYDLIVQRSDKVKNFFKIKKDVPKFWALKGISLQVNAGESLGLVGINGSGKSTLSNIIAGVIPPTSGEVVVDGETSIISIGVGLKNELTGVENVYLKLLMSGLTYKQVDEKFDEIVAFSDLGDFIKQPVKSYSSGMKSRLGFAIATHTDPEIILIDEALSVGDDTFYQKCVDKIKEFQEQGKTIVFVSHNLGQIESLCDKVAWIEHGKLKKFGEAKEIVSEYREYTKWYRSLSNTEKASYNKKAREDRSNFSITEHYEKTVQGLDPKERRKMKEIFFTNHLSDRLGFLSIFTVGILTILLLALIIVQYRG